MTGVLFFCLLLTAGADPEVTVRTTDGKVQTGELAAISAEQLTLAGQGAIPLRNIQLVTTAPPSNKQPPGAVVVEMADGSRLFGNEFTSSGVRASLTLTDGEAVTIPRRSLKTLRYQHPTPASPEQWQQAIQTTAAGDLLIIRKAAKSGEGLFFDALEGTVGEITAEAVKFDFDGDKIDVKREKIEGIAFFKPAKPNATLLCRLQVEGKGTFPISRLELKAGNLQVETQSGVLLAIPLSTPLALDFRSANEIRLAELEPDSHLSTFSLQPKGMKHDFSKIFGLRTNGPFGGSGLRLGKQTFDSGLTLHSPTTVIYRVPEGCRKFAAVAGISEDAGRSADLRLKVLADQTVAIDRVFNSESGRGPVQLECDLAGVRRLTLQIEAGEGLDLGDILILGDARFVK